MAFYTLNSHSSVCSQPLSQLSSSHRELWIPTTHVCSLVSSGIAPALPLSPKYYITKHRLLPTRPERQKRALDHSWLPASPSRPRWNGYRFHPEWSCATTPSLPLISWCLGTKYLTVHFALLGLQNNLTVSEVQSQIRLPVEGQAEHARDTTPAHRAWPGVKTGAHPSEIPCFSHTVNMQR